MTASTPKTLDDLRAPFPPAVVGVLPKPYKKDAPKGNCSVCGTYHGMPAAHLDFVGHAAVTDRLLTVDPAWTWEPVAFDSDGLPAYDRGGGLWIRLTVLGVTRLGYGDGPDPKQRIGDAIRNAAMRFGVALDLWTKGELESTDPNGGDATANGRPFDPRPAETERPAERPQRGAIPAGEDPFAAPEWATSFRSRLAKAMTEEALADRRAEVRDAVKNGEVSPEWGNTLMGEITARKAHLAAAEASPAAAA